jgi:uncharacterized protein YbjT (DUF2867 family)
MSDKKIVAVIGATGTQGGGLARAILADPQRPFALRAITRKTDSDKARALAAAGAEVVPGDADDPASLERALAGAHGAFLVTNFWEHFSPERELKQAAAMARAAKAAGVAHAVWSTLEDTRLSFPLDDPRLKTLQGKYKVPHFDAKGEADAIFAAEGAPTSYLMVAFYWENFIYFGQGPRKGAHTGSSGAGRRSPASGSASPAKCSPGPSTRPPFPVTWACRSRSTTCRSTTTGRSAFPERTTWETCTSTTPSSGRSSAATAPPRSRAR